MNKKYMLWGLFVCSAVHSLALDQELLEQKKQEAITILNRHEYMAAVYSAALLGLAGGYIYTWQYYGAHPNAQPAKKVEVQIDSEVGTFENIKRNLYGIGMLATSGAYYLVQGSVISYITGLCSKALAATPQAQNIQKNVASSFARANMNWFIRYHTDFHEHAKQAQQRARYFMESIKSNKTAERDAVLELLKKDFKDLEYDCYAILGALQAFQECDYLEINLMMEQLHQAKIEKTIQECIRQLIMPDEQVIALAAQKKDIVSILQDFEIYIDLIFV